MHQRLALVRTSINLAAKHLQSIFSQDVTHTHGQALPRATLVAILALD
jgi:hypothetical protein